MYMISTERVMNFDNLVFKSKEVFSDWEYLICENDGSYSQDLQYMTFDYNGSEVCVGFTLSIRGNYWYSPATYMSPEEGDVRITDVEVDVDYLSIDDNELSFDKEVAKTLEKVVKKYIGNE